MKGLDLIDDPSFGHNDVLQRKPVNGVSREMVNIGAFEREGGATRIGLWNNVSVNLPG